MELIPVLSTIILVATITTFILAIGAYILYKKREKSGRAYTTRTIPPSSGELIVPVRSAEKSKPVSTVVQKSKIQEDVLNGKIVLEKQAEGQPLMMKIQKQNAKASDEKRLQSKFLKYTSEGYTSAKENVEGGTLKWK